MRYIKKRYRLFYFPFVLISLLLFSAWKLWDFLLNGLLPEQEITVGIEGFNGEYKKVYRKDGREYIGGTVELVDEGA
jgi:hypothetical protein